MIVKKSKPEAEKFFGKKWCFWLYVILHGYAHVLLAFMLFSFATKYPTIVDCIMDNFQIASQLDDPVYGAQVTQNCWTYGIHPNNYIRYTGNGPTLYLKKYIKRDSRPIEFYERQMLETEFLRAHTVLIGLFSFAQFFVFFVTPLIEAGKRKFVMCLNLFQLVLLFICLKPITYGQYSSRPVDVRLEDLFSFPPDDRPVVESLPENYLNYLINSGLKFTPRIVKIVDSDAFCPATENARTRTLMVLLVMLAFASLIELVRWITTPIKLTNETATKSTTSKPVNASISSENASIQDNSTSISTKSNSASKSPDDHAITIGETEI